MLPADAAAIDNSIWMFFGRGVNYQDINAGDHVYYKVSTAKSATHGIVIQDGADLKVYHSYLGNVQLETLVAFFARGKVCRAGYGCSANLQFEGVANQVYTYGAGYKNVIEDRARELYGQFLGQLPPVASNVMSVCCAAYIPHGSHVSCGKRHAIVFEEDHVLYTYALAEPKNCNIAVRTELYHFIGADLKSLVVEKVALVPDHVDTLHTLCKNATRGGIKATFSDESCHSEEFVTRIALAAHHNRLWLFASEVSLFQARQRLTERVARAATLTDEIGLPLQAAVQRLVVRIRDEHFDQLALRMEETISFPSRSSVCYIAAQTQEQAPAAQGATVVTPEQLQGIASLFHYCGIIRQPRAVTVNQLTIPNQDNATAHVGDSIQRERPSMVLVDVTSVPTQPVLTAMLSITQCAGVGLVVYIVPTMEIAMSFRDHMHIWE